MVTPESVKAFYHSKAWRDLSYLKRIQVGHCERCGKIVDIEHLHAHHKIYLTAENVTDPIIALNPDNIEVLCDSCHNQEHERFEHSKEVYIVYGAPCSGKTSWAMERMNRNDIIVDLDRIYESFSSAEDGHDHSDALRFIAFRIRDLLYDIILTRYSYFEDAYIIGGFPNRGEREDLARRLGAHLIHIDTDRETCIERATASRPKKYIELIENYFVNFEK
jgi:predicted kinase